MGIVARERIAGLVDAIIVRREATGIEPLGAARSFRSPWPPTQTRMSRWLGR
ncbi:MAG: hypothetical protein ABJC13_02510 [Acidobacteriota bacterium]